ncbi:hypothetical protein [Burkholderia anthina]|nr:hypothetical protein [Burkholderia anthina]
MTILGWILRCESNGLQLKPPVSSVTAYDSTIDAVFNVGGR